MNPLTPGKESDDAHASSLLPRVSILTPSLNQMAFLGRCIDSVASQSYPKIEHIICDGGSTDGTVGFLRAGQHAGVRWVSEVDGGQADAVNRALQRSSGEIVGWLNSDDAFADRRAVELAVQAFATRPGVGIVYGGALLVNEEDVVLQALPAGVLSVRTLRAVHHAIQPSFLFRRSILPDPFLKTDLNFVFDRDLLLRLLARERAHRLSVFVAVDRHQRRRKVETGDWRAEQQVLDSRLGLRPSRFDRALSVFIRASARVRGVLWSIVLPRRIQPATRLVFPPLATRLRLQLLTRRADMPFSTGASVRAVKPRA